jgi:hypothetical protein
VASGKEISNNMVVNKFKSLNLVDMATGKSRQSLGKGDFRFHGIYTPMKERGAK